MPDIIKTMVLHKQRQSGFTVIELVIVFAVVVILATLVIFSYNGVRSRDRDATRQENIVTLQGELEIYYAENSKYPTLAQINDTEWRSENMPELNAGTLEDPSWSDDATCTKDNQPTLIVDAAEKCYAYNPTAANGEKCGSKTPCAHYTLTAMLETDEQYIKTSLN